MSDAPPDDCPNCAALCCMALAFDASDYFAYDKPAGVACRNLRAGGDCNIHADLSASGFRGCVQYTCHGVGPRVVQDCFDGATWQDDPTLTAPMIDAFSMARKLNDLFLLLEATHALPLTTADIATRDALAHRLTPPPKMTLDWLHTMTASNIDADVRVFLRGLRHTAHALR